MRLKAPGFLGEEGGAPIRIGRLFLSRIDSPSAAPSRGFDSGFVLADRSLFSFGSLADIPPGTKARLNTNNIATSERTQNLGITFIRTSQGNQTDFCTAAIEEDRRIARYSVAKRRAEKQIRRTCVYNLTLACVFLNGVANLFWSSTLVKNNKCQKLFVGV